MLSEAESALRAEVKCTSNQRHVRRAHRDVAPGRTGDWVPTDQAEGISSPSRGGEQSDDTRMTESENAFFDLARV